MIRTYPDDKGVNPRILRAVSVQFCGRTEERCVRKPVACLACEAIRAVTGREDVNRDSPAELYNFRPFNGSWPDLGHTAHLLLKKRETSEKASLPKPPERLLLEGSFPEQTMCHNEQATCMPQEWP